jgi:protein gp37
MAATTKIEWTDATFNPWIGCTKVSPACDACYAAVSTPARALKIEWGPGKPRHRTSEATWRQPLVWERQHAKFYAQHGRRRRVFCASLADVFDNEVDTQWRTDLWALIASTPNLDWLLLTKRIGNVKYMLPTSPAHYRPWNERWPWKNVLLGATIANQEEADRDIPKLLATPARVRFLSCEPLLGPVEIRGDIESCGDCDPCIGGQPKSCPVGWWYNSALHPGSIGWVIAGGESGPHARPSHPDWFRSLRDQCAAAGVAFFMKQMGGARDKRGKLEDLPEDLRIRQFPVSP